MHSENNISLNSVIVYNAGVKEMVVSKLSAFYNKVLLENEARLIILLPPDVEIHKADRHKMTFDEVVVIKFNADNSSFWNVRNLAKFYYFTTSVTNIDKPNILLDYGKVFRNVPPISESAEIIAAYKSDDTELMDYVNQQLADNCGCKMLTREELQYYDFSAFYVSDETRAIIQGPLKNILQSYPKYIDSRCSYAIISWLVAHLKVNVRTLDMEYIDISDSELVEDFYTII